MLNIKTLKLQLQKVINNDSVYISYKLNMCNKYIGFDLDHTLIKPKNGKKFAIDEYDYEYLFSNTREHLIELSKTYTIVIFSNQSKFNDGIINKIKHIQDDLNIKFCIFISKLKDNNRKPQVGLYDLFKNLTSSTISMYVGDASGRKNDHSFSDLYFAHNINVPFMTPELYFLGVESSINTFNINPYVQFKHDYKFTDNYDTIIKDITDNLQPYKSYVIFMCGCQGSGKSTWANTTGLPIVNQDILGTKAKCISATKKHILSGDNFIIDKIFTSVEDRYEYLSLIPEGYKCICVYLDVSLFVGKHLNQLRDKKVPTICYSKFNKYFVKPTTDEFNHVYTLKPNYIDMFNIYLIDL